MRMNLHPAAWIGFLLNCLVAYLFLTALAGIDISAFTEEEQYLIGMVMEKGETIRSILYVTLAMQAVALGLLATRSPLGLAVAVLGALLMLPGSLVYLIGCLLTHYRNKFLEFTPALKAYGEALFRFSSASAPIMRITASASIALSFLAVYTGWLNAAALCFGVSLAALFFAFRSRTIPPLAIFEDCFTVTPGLFASSVLIPYAKVSLATLRPDECILFLVETEQGLRSLPWSLRSVLHSERREALERLGSALSEHGVPLDQA
jgi:hypothetical protein